MSGILLKSLGVTEEDVGEPSSLHFGGISSAMTAQPRNILTWLYDSAPHHYMHKRFAMPICLRGACGVGVDTNTFTLEPDEGILIFPFQSHFLVPPKKGRLFNLAVTFALEDSSDNSLAPLRDSVFKVSSKDAVILAELFTLARGSDPRRKPEVAHLLQRFLCRKLLDKSLGREVEPAKKLVESKYDRIVRYIRDHITEPITAKDIAAAENLSVPHLRRVFKERTGGLNVGRFILSLRVKQAYEMLMHTELNIAEISARCGFTDQFVFSRAFKRIAGMSPTNYRKSIQRPSTAREL